MRKYSLFLSVLVLCAACTKHSGGSSGQNNPTYFTDIMMNESINNDQQFQNSVGYFSLTSDPTAQIMVASRGMDEQGAQGFRIARINKADGTVNWIKSYEVDPNAYYIQLVTCSAMDKNEDIWVGGHTFQTGNPNDPGKPFLAKLDNNGNILWSKTISNPGGIRASSVIVLRNGDIAFMVKTLNGITVYRFTAAGQPLWGTTCIYQGSIIIDDYLNVSTDHVSPTNHVLTETADGSIFFAVSSNTPVAGMDRLVKLDGKGNFQFAKSYISGSPAIARPVQLTTVADNMVLLTDQKTQQLEPAIYFYLLSTDGQVTQSKGMPLNQSSDGNSFINEVDYFNDKIYLSTCGNTEIRTYALDNGLNVISTAKTLGVNTLTTERGGVALFDADAQSLFYVLDLAGMYGESNGFEVERTDLTGKSCISGVEMPAALVLQNVNATVAADSSVTAGNTAAAILTDLGWQQIPVSISSIDKPCTH